jgi:hypothetical protein
VNRDARTFDDYEWGRLIEEAKLRKLVTVELDKYLLNFSLSTRGTKEAKALLIEAHWCSFNPIPVAISNRLPGDTAAVERSQDAPPQAPAGSRMTAEDIESDLSDELEEVASMRVSGLESLSSD